jgi:integrase
MGLSIRWHESLPAHPRYPERKRTRLIKNRELEKLFAYLDQADAEGLEHPSFTFGIRLQFAFAARMSEIITMRWDWIDLDERRVVWPDSKTGGISKPLTEEALELLARVHGVKDLHLCAPPSIVLTVI